MRREADVIPRNIADREWDEVLTRGWRALLEVIGNAFEGRLKLFIRC